MDIEVRAGRWPSSLLIAGLLCALGAFASASAAQDAPAGPPAPAPAPAVPEAPAATAPAMAPATAPAGRVPATELASLARGDDALVARVGDVTLRRSDAFRILDLATPAKSAEVIRQMVLTTGAQLDAVKEGLDVPADELASAVEAAISEQKASFALEVNEHMPLEEYLRQRHGMTPEDYHAEVHRMVLASMLLERAVRLDQQRTDREELELIVVEDEALGREIERQLTEGASFAVLAKKHSLHPSAAAGGALPPVPADAKVPLLEGRTALEPGQWLGPAPITIGDKHLWRLVRLVDRATASTASWTELRDTIERGLRERPLTPDELTLFEARVVDRYGVTRFARSP